MADTTSYREHSHWWPVRRCSPEAKDGDKDLCQAESYNTLTPKGSTAFQKGVARTSLPERIECEICRSHEFGDLKLLLSLENSSRGFLSRQYTLRETFIQSLFAREVAKYRSMVRYLNSTGD